MRPVMTFRARELTYHAREARPPVIMDCLYRLPLFARLPFDIFESRMTYPQEGVIVERIKGYARDDEMVWDAVMVWEKR